MGSPLAPVLANFFMGHYEKLWLNNYTGPKVLYYRRYVDDIICCFRNSYDACLFFEYLNSWHPNKFTIAPGASSKIGNGERGTGNGERGTGNGERGMGNGEWGTGNGERGMGNGKRGTGNGERGISKRGNL